MRRWLLLVVLAACEGGKPRAVEVGSAAPAHVHADAALAPIVEHAAAIDAGGLDDAVRARLPETPIWIAVPVYLDGITIAKLDRSGLQIVTTDMNAGDESFAWVDDHHLVTLSNGFEAGWTVTQFVDGVRDKQVTIAKSEWDQVSSTLLVTRTGEVYIYDCTKWGDNYGPCLTSNYARMLPVRGGVTTKRPLGVIDHRDAQPYIGNELWPLPPTARTPPRDITLAIDRRRTRPVTSYAVCTSGGTAVRYPNDTWDGSYGFTAEKLRWVSATPPIYELSAIVVDPVDQEEHVHRYFHACDDAPVHNYAWLADGIWAEHDELAEPSAWTVYLDATPIGTIAGLGALRATGSRK